MKRPEPTEMEEKDAVVPEGTDEDTPEETPEAGPRSTVDVFLNEDAEAMGEDGEEDELDISDYPNSPLEEEMLAVLDKMLDEEEAEFLTQYARFAKHLSAQEVAAGPVDEAPVPEGTGKADPTWDELEHPREADGTFAEKEGGKSGYVSAKSKGPGDFPEDSEQQLISLREEFKMGDKKTDLSLAAEQERLAILELSLSKAAGWDESEHPREEDGKFAEKESSGASGSSGYVPGKEMTYEDFPENARELFLAEHKRLREKGDRGDAYLSALNKIQGYDGLPTLVTEEEMDRMVESGEVTDRIYRGCPPAYGEPHNKYTKQFLEGEFYAGQGLYGNGTYTSLDRATARSYGNGMEEAQLNLGIRKGAKIVSFEDLENEYQAEYDRLKKLPRQDRSIIQDVIMEGISNFAVMRGYDGFRIRKNGHVVILNRTAVYAEDKPRKLYSEQPQPTYDLSTPAKSTWEEAEHPREADGTFAEKEETEHLRTEGGRFSEKQDPDAFPVVFQELQRIFLDLGGNPSLARRLNLSEGSSPDWVGLGGGGRVVLNPKVMAGVERFLQGARDVDSVNSYGTLVHEAYHNAFNPGFNPDGNWINEGITSIRSEAYVKQRFPETIGVLKESYPQPQRTLRLLAAANGGEDFLEKIFRSSGKASQSLLTRAYRKYVRDLVERKGGSPALAANIARSVKKPDNLGFTMNDLEGMNPWDVVRYLGLRGEGLDWRKIRDESRTKSTWEESEHPREADGTFTQKESLASSIKSGSRKIVTDDSWYDADSWRQNLKTVIGEDTLIGFDGDRERVALVNPATGEVLAAGILVKSGGQDGYPVKHSVTGLKSSATRKGYATRLYERLLSYVPSLRPEFKQTPDGKAFWDSLKKNPKFVWDEAQGLKLVSPAKALQTWDESEHPRDADGKFINKARMAEMVAASDATYIRINEGDFDFENIDSDITQILTDFLDSEEYKEGSYTGDAVLSLILKNNTMDSLPVVVSSEDMDQLEASGQLAARCYRGVVSPTPGEYAEQYRTGDMYVGYGIRGNGVYTSSNFDIASVYSGGDDRDILDIGIRKDARIIQFHKLESLMNSTMDKTFESMGIDPNSSSAQLKNARPEQRAILEDPGRLAAFLGYDAIESTLGHDGLDIPPVPMFIILNRAATFVVGAPEQAQE